MSKRTVNPAPTTPIEKVARWKSPTGRWLEPGQTFQVEGRGWFKFLAYVGGEHPYVEAKKKGSPNIRCIRPETITRVSKKVTR